MNIKQIRIVNYKNHENINLNFEKNVVCFVGLNGVGKTNILDAIHFSCVGKSYFSGSDKICIKDNAQFFRLETNFVDNELVITLEKGKRKKLVLNDAPITKLSNYMGKFPIVVIAPDDNVIILGGSEERRKLMDHTLAQTDTKYFHYLNEYNKLLVQRNALLKKNVDQKIDLDLLQIYNLKMIEPAEYIYNSRKQFIKDIETYFNEAYAAISNKKEELKVVYDSKLEQNSIVNLFKNSQAKDLILKRTTEGIHKDDLIFLMNDFKVKQYSSQGQQKTFLLALKLSQYFYLKDKLKKPTIFIIDDIFDKLDTERSKNLIKFVCNNQNQVFISHTSKKMLEEELKEVDFQLVEIK